MSDKEPEFHPSVCTCSQREERLPQSNVRFSSLFSSSDIAEEDDAEARVNTALLLAISLCEAERCGFIDPSDRIFWIDFPYRIFDRFFNLSLFVRDDGYGDNGNGDGG